MELIQQTLTLSLQLLLLCFAIPFVYSTILYLLEKKSSQMMRRSVGWKGVLLTAWLGTPVHEIGHALFCIIFRHKIKELKLYDPDPNTGTLGYVRHSFDSKNIYQQLGRFFIGVAPIVCGCIVLGLLFKLFNLFDAGLFAELLPKTKVEAGHNIVEAVSTLSKEALSSVPMFFDLDRLRQPLYLIFLYLVLCVSSHMSPSRADLAGALPGFLLFISLIILLVLALLAFGVDYSWLFEYSAKLVKFFLPLINLAVCLSCVHFIIVLGLFLILSPFRR